MAFEYKKLRGRIVEKYGTLAEFSKALGYNNNVSVSRKMNGKIDFSKDDIVKWCELLGIELEDVGAYFFS